MITFSRRLFSQINQYYTSRTCAYVRALPVSFVILYYFRRMLANQADRSLHHIRIFIGRTVAPNSENGETGDYIAWLDAPGQITHDKESSTPGSCSTLADPKSCWPLSTEFKNSESDVGGRDRRISTHFSIPLSRARDIYCISRIQPTCTEAAEFARKSTMQNYCPHTSFSAPKFGCARWRIAFAASAGHPPCSVYTWGSLQLPLNVFACRFNHHYIHISIGFAEFTLLQFYLLIFMINTDKVR